MTITHVEHTSPVQIVSRPHVLRGLQFAVTTAHTWMDRARKRHELRGLLSRDERVFKDIGVQRQDVHLESSKWFWQD